MARILCDADLRDLVDIPSAVACMEEGYRADARGEIDPFPRSRYDARGVSVAVLGAAIARQGVLGLRSYLHGADGSDRGEQVVTLYSHPDMAVRAVFLGRLVGHLRTGAALAAALHLTDPGAREIGVLGTGAQARNALACIAAVQRPVRVLAWSPTAAHREEFRSWSERTLGLEVEIGASAEEVVATTSVVLLATAAEERVVAAEAVRAPTLFLSIGAYRRPELDPRLLEAAPRVWTDSVVQACGPDTWFEGGTRREKLRPLGDGVADGSVLDRSVHRIVINTGAAWEEVLLAKVLWERAEATDRGTVVDLPRDPPGATVF